MKKSLRLTKIAGIPVDVHYTWFIVFGLVTWTLATSGFSYFRSPFYIHGLSPSAYWAIAFISTILLFLSLLLHEIAHSLVAIKRNLPIKGITLFIFGGVAHMTKEPDDPKTEFMMAIAGPITSFSLSILFFFISRVFLKIGFSPVVFVIANYLFWLNLLVGIFNLFPGFPLDGGRILRAGLWSYFKDLRLATRIASNFGKAFAYFLMIMGLFEIFGRALLSGFWLIFIGLFLLEAAETSYQQVVIKETLTGSKVKDIMTKNVVTVPGEITLHDLIEEYFFKYRFHSFPVVSEDKLLGLITLHDVKTIPKTLWNDKKAKDTMTPISENIIVEPFVETIDALTKMARNGIGRLLVIDGGKLVGILSQRDVMSLFEFKNHLG